MIVFAQEKLTAALLEELEPLALQHFKECDPFPELEPDMNPEIYFAADETGKLRIYTARADGKIVGYAVFVVYPHTHYKDSIQATPDLLYLEPSMRQGFNGIKFLRWMDEQLAAEGVQAVYQMSTMRKDIGAVLSRVGYEPIQVLWARRLA